MLWSEIPESVLTKVDGILSVSASGVRALPWKDACELCYDADTPPAVVKLLMAHPDASVRLASRQRGQVLNGNLVNPFERSNP